VEELVILGLSKQYSTIVSVGGDELANSIATKLVGSKIAMGIIPCNASPALQKLVGTGDWKVACEVLRYRKISEIKIGRTASNKCFLTYVELDIKSPVEITLEFKDYMVQTKALSLIIANYYPDIKKIASDHLDIMIESASSGDSAMTKFASFLGFGKKDTKIYQSLFRARSLRIFTKSQIPILANGITLAKSPQLIESTDENLRLITAKKMGEFWS
jgi:hypothetical protein